MTKSKILVKLILSISFFFISNDCFAGSKKIQNSLLETISAQLKLSGDLVGSVQFNGGLGAQLIGVAELLSKSCEVQALFRKAFYKKKIQIEVWLQLKCASVIPGKAQLVISAPKFYIDEKSSTNEYDFSDLSAADFKKIHLQFTELKISQKQLK